MNRRGSLWRIIRPLEEGATAGWMRVYYDHMYQMAFRARTIEDVAKISIAHAHATFRPQVVAVALRERDSWNVLLCLHALAAGIGFDRVGAAPV